MEETPQGNQDPARPKGAIAIPNSIASTNSQFKARGRPKNSALLVHETKDQPEIVPPVQGHEVSEPLVRQLVSDHRSNALLVLVGALGGAEDLEQEEALYDDSIKKDRLRYLRTSGLTHFTELTIGRNLKPSLSFFKARSEKTHLQTLHWSILIG